MNAKHLSEGETNNGKEKPSCEREMSAASGHKKATGDNRIEGVAGLEDGVVLGRDLFAYGMKEGGRWKLLDYFNTHAKAVNAAKRAKANMLRAFYEDKEFDVFQYNPKTSVWEKQGDFYTHVRAVHMV